MRPTKKESRQLRDEFMRANVVKELTLAKEPAFLSEASIAELNGQLTATAELGQ
jgi:hypothetical protein